MSDLKSDADLLHLALTHEGDEFAARVVNDLQTQLAAMTAERDAANSQKAGAVKAFLMADNPDDLRCAQWVIANGSAKRRDGDE